MERRENVARNCSGRSDGGGGLKRRGIVGSSGGRLGLGLLVVAAKRVRVSERGMRGKEAVEKT